MDFFMGKQLFKSTKLIDLLNSYRQLTGKHYIIETNDRKFNKVEIIFSDENFPHLVGLQKMSSLNRYVASSKSKDIIKAIEEYNLTMEQVLSDKNFYDIEPRIQTFDFMIDMFVNLDCTPAFLQIKDMKPRRLRNVDFILYQYIDNGRRIEVAGFSEMNNNWFAPATLHIRKAPNSFTDMRRARINKITIT